MAGGLILPVAAGLVVGVAIIAIFALTSFRPPEQPTTNDPLDQPLLPDLPEKIWMGRSPTQCAEPWQTEEWHNASGGRFTGETGSMISFLESQGITIYETKYVESSEFDGNTLKFFEEGPLRCEGCGCLDAHTIFVLVPRSNVDEMQDLYFHIYYGDFDQAGVHVNAKANDFLQRCTESLPRGVYTCDHGLNDYRQLICSSFADADICTDTRVEEYYENRGDKLFTYQRAS